MDERLKEALDFSSYMITLQNQKRILNEQYKESLIYYYNKGQFSVTQPLISFLQTLVNLNQTEVVLVDDNGIPVQVEDIKLFFVEVLNLYFTSTNNYLVEYNKVVSKRSVKDMLDL
jgi:hypothetical protein